MLSFFPSSARTSNAVARSPSLAVWPFTDRRPASIQPSISRREPRPAAASSFCSRSAGRSGGLLFVLSCGLGRLVADGGFCRFGAGGRGLQLEGLGDFFKRRQLLQ